MPADCAAQALLVLNAHACIVLHVCHAADHIQQLRTGGVALRIIGLKAVHLFKHRLYRLCNRDWKRNSSSAPLRVASQYIFNGQLLGSRPPTVLTLQLLL